MRSQGGREIGRQCLQRHRASARRRTARANGHFADAALRAQVIGDGHAPARFRALTVRNIDAWYDTFKVKDGAKLYLKPEERVKIW